jgi:hypothetical protein
MLSKQASTREGLLLLTFANERRSFCSTSGVDVDISAMVSMEHLSTADAAIFSAFQDVVSDVVREPLSLD